jgi:hypothetical protein
MKDYTSSWAINEKGGATKLWRYKDGPPRITMALAKQAYYEQNHVTSAALQAGSVARRIGNGQ